MSGWLSDPVIQAVLLPLVVALVATGMLRVLVGPTTAAVSIAVGFLVAYLVIAGFPLYPPRSSEHKMVVLVTVAAGVGLLLDSLRIGRFMLGLWAVSVPLGGTVWFVGWERIVDNPDVGFIVVALAAALAGVVVMVRLDRLRGAALAPCVMLLVASYAAAVIAWSGASMKFAMLFAALGSATLGFMVWNWPVVRHPPIAGFVLGAGGAFVLMAIIVALYVLGDLGSRLALLILAGVFFMDRVVPASRSNGAIGPLLLLVPCVGVGAVAVLIARFT